MLLRYILCHCRLLADKDDDDDSIVTVRWRSCSLQIRDLRSFEIRFEFESAVPTPWLVVSLVKRLNPLTALSGTVYRLAE